MSIVQKVIYPFRLARSYIDVNNGTGKWIYSSIIFSIVFGFGGYRVYNIDRQQKTNSTLVKGLGHYLRKDPKALDLLGSHIAVDDYSAYGKINAIKGFADVTFAVTGEKDKAIVKYKGAREAGDWISEIFTVTPISNPDRKIEY